MARESRVFWAHVARKGRRSSRARPHNEPPLFPGGLMLHRSCALATVILIAACSDRPGVTPPSESMAPPISPSARPPIELARMVAKGLKNPAFRAYLKAQLNASPYREHKLEFKTFLAANDDRAMREIAVENGTPKDALAGEAQGGIGPGG